MNQVANPEMLTLAREVRGMTQTELAEVSGIDQGRISRYEGTVKAIPYNELEILAKALSFPIEFFYQDGKRRGTEISEIYHRKRQSLSASEQKRIDGLLNVYRLGVEELLKAVDLSSSYTIPMCEVDEAGSNIEEIAAIVRATWDMPSGPVDNLIASLEAASCLIFSYDFGTDLVDEAVQWIEPMPPIILVNARAPGDRLRFSLAHALGHLVMHHNKLPYPKMEDEANQFASAFLMPAEDIRLELTPVSIDHLLHLKPYWKVSMQALIHRAQDIGEIGATQYKSLFQSLSRFGYRKNEPFPIAVEKPELIRSLLNIYKEDLNFSNAELAKLVKLNTDDFQAWYYARVSPPHLTLVDKSDRLTG